MDWTPIVAAVLPALVAAGTAIYLSRKIKNVGGAVNSIHIDMNSRFDQWMAAEKAKSHAEGKLEGRAEERDG